MNKPDEMALELLQGRRIASLSTHDPDGHIHVTAVWFLFKDDALYVTTNSNSQKVRNLQARPEAALMVDAREPGCERGVAARGSVEILTGEEVATLRDEIHERYLTDRAMDDPQIAGFFASFDDTVLRLTPES